jgi:carboxyl-terminal processing protease
MKKPLLVALAIAATGFAGFGSAALASPAEDLVKQGAFYIGFYYNGPAKVPYWRELQKTMLADVQKVCAGDAKCGYDKGAEVIKATIKSINDGFTEYRTADAVDDEDRFAEGKGPAKPTIGVTVGEFPGRGLIVLEVFPGEPGFDAGLARGDVITTIAGQPATLAALKAAETGAKPFDLAYSTKGAAKTASITGKLVEDGRIPYRQSLAGGKALLIRIPNLFGSETTSIGNRVHQTVRRAITDKATGIVIDLRDSISGYDSEALLAAGAFVKEGGFIYDRRFQGQDETYTLTNNGGRITARDEAGNQGVVGQADAPQNFTGGVVVLVNKRTVNSAEMLAWFLQKPGRAKVIGEPTAGALTVSGFNLDLVNGDYIAVSSLRMLNLDKTPFPNAITPDVVAPDDYANLASGVDTQLQKALETLGVQ